MTSSPEMASTPLNPLPDTAGTYFVPFSFVLSLLVYFIQVEVKGLAKGLIRFEYYSAKEPCPKGRSGNLENDIKRRKTRHSVRCFYIFKIQ